MPCPTSRRQFLKLAAVASAGVPALVGRSGQADNPQRADGRLENNFFTVAFDAASGEINITRRNGELLLSRARVRVLTPSGVINSSDPHYDRTYELTNAPDGVVGGRQMIARFLDRRRQLNLEWRLTLLEGLQGIVVEAACQNVSGEPAVIQGIQPIRASAAEGGSCSWPEATKLLTNGQMYYDAGKVRQFKPGEEVGSWWNVAFYAGDNRECLVAGYLENKSSQGQITVRSADSLGGTARSGAFSLTALSGYQREFLLKPGATVLSDRILLLIGPNPFSALESYAGLIGRLHHVRLNGPINGWCSWFSFFGDITEAEVLRNTEFAAKALKPFGFEYIQVDDGFYRAFGDWEGNGRFPHGMKWLAQQIRGLGLKPGIWLAPYVIGEASDVFRQHPDWLIRGPNGKPKQIAPGVIEETKEAEQLNSKLYALDITHPGAANWLGNLFDTAANDWGYDFFKIDFLEWSLLAAQRFHDPSVTKAAAYRRGVEIMRQAIGPKRHLLDCGPGNISAGLLDSMRIELDQPAVTWQQYFLHSTSTAPAAAKRYYFHHRTWINDADHVVLANLTPTQGQAAATIVSLSGGNMIAGDRLADLDAVRLNILGKAFPSFGEAARPIDLFDSDRPEVFALHVTKPFGAWLVLGVFNADPQAAKEKSIPLERLNLDPARKYIAYDFWEQKFYGELAGQLTLKLPPASVVLLAIHEKRGKPQFISTDRHVSQGGVELEDVQWDEAAKALRGISVGAPGTDHRVFVYLPEKHPWTQTTPFFFHDFPGYTLKVVEENIVSIRVRFAQGNRVAWQVNPSTLFGG